MFLKLYGVTGSWGYPTMLANQYELVAWEVRRGNVRRVRMTNEPSVQWSELVGDGEMCNEAVVPTWLASQLGDVSWRGGDVEM